MRVSPLQVWNTSLFMSNVSFKSSANTRLFWSRIALRVNDSVFSLSIYNWRQNKLRQLATEHTGNDTFTVCKENVQKVRFRDTPPSPTIINFVPLSTRLVENRKTQHCLGDAGEGTIFAPSLKPILKDKSVSTILTPTVALATKRE